MVPGLKRVAIGLASAGQADVCAGLMAWRVGLVCEPEGGGVMLTCLVSRTRLEKNVPEAVERTGPHQRIADLAKTIQCLLEVPGGLFGAAESDVSIAEPDQDLGFACSITDLLE